MKSDRGTEKGLLHNSNFVICPFIGKTTQPGPLQALKSHRCGLNTSVRNDNEASRQHKTPVDLILQGIMQLSCHS